jgi:uncharacterized protein YbaP (TraB family)
MIGVGKKFEMRQKIQDFCVSSLKLAATALLATAIVTQAAAKPAVWVVHSSTATVYLFGTIHPGSAKVAWHSAAVDAALAESDEIWTEADTPRPDLLNRLLRRYGNSRRALPSVLPKSYKARFETAMNSAGFNPADFTRVYPWLAEYLLQESALRRRHTASSINTGLLKFAHDHGKDTVTLDDPREQFSLLADLPLRTQVHALEFEIDSAPYTKGGGNAMIDAWQNGDEKAIDRLSTRHIAEVDDRYLNEVIVRRSENFARTIETRLQGGGSAFVAIDIPYLCGSASVPVMLRNRGYSVERVPD